MRRTLVLAVTAAVPWVLILTFGVLALTGVHSRGVSGYPSDDQLCYYIYIPGGVVALVVITLALSFRYRFLRSLVNLIAAVALAVLPRYLLYFTGGV